LFIFLSLGGIDHTETGHDTINGFFCICTGTTNNILTGKVVNINSPADATLNCTFLSGFTGSARCTVEYGTDPTYMNLPYSAESTETGTAGDTVSVVLRERLNSSTVYYYTVSAVSRDTTVLMHGTFITPEFSKYVLVVIQVGMGVLVVLCW